MAVSKVLRRSVLKTGAATAFLPITNMRANAALANAGFPAPITSIPFGSNSHWLQPWRELCSTRSFDQVKASVGVNISGYNATQSALDMLRGQGFANARVEIGWGQVDPQNEGQFLRQIELTSYIARLGQAGLRPLILLNANDQGPCPFVAFNVQLTTAAPAGAQIVTLSSTAGLIPGRSGFAIFPGAALASVLVTEINGQNVSLSQPLPTAVPANTNINFVSLNYEPFSVPGSAQNAPTMQGWLRYVGLVCQTVTSTLGTANNTDQGFDLEIWNELTFGSRFLNINNYYKPALVAFDPTSVWTEIVQQTATYISANANNYQGVGISDGFANTIPWPASSTEPPRINALSKHTYPPMASFPPGPEPTSVNLDANGKTTTFIPTYQSYFPEYYGTAIQTESTIRDGGFRNNYIQKCLHGKQARVVNGEISPVDVWVTEIGCCPSNLGITDPTEVDRLMTAFLLRSLFFFTGIGFGRVLMYCAFGQPGGFGLVNFATPNTASLSLICLGRLLSAIEGDQDASPSTSLTPITWGVFRRPTDKILFSGHNTTNLPPMTTSDSLVLLPLQVSPTRFAIIYYVMTRNILVPLSPQNLIVWIEGTNIQNFEVTAYDPMADESLAISTLATSKNMLTLEISATDVPRVILLDSAS